MKLTHSTALMFIAAFGLGACGPAEPKAPTPETQSVESPSESSVSIAAPSASSEPANAFAESGDQTWLDPITLGNFSTKVMHIGEVSKGHFNLYIEGGEPAAVRAWIGDEAATSVLVTKAEFEVDHHCAHLEVAQPLPEGAQFWLEIETTDGQRLKGSTPLQ